MAEEERHEVSRVSEHFPIVRAACKKEAVVFFRCFTAAAAMKDDKDSGDNGRAVRQCAQEMARYDECMLKELSKD